MEKKYDFFISYNHKDESYANWIAWILEEAGYSVFIQAWDFRPGNNIVLLMQTGAANAKCTLALLSNNYMLSNFTQPEWASAFGSDPTGNLRNLIPILIEDIDLEGLLPQIIYISLVGKSEEESKKVILEGVQIERAKPVTAPLFPGIISQKNKTEQMLSGSWYNQWLDNRISELEKGLYHNDIEPGAKIVVHLIPIESISKTIDLEIKQINDPLKLKPLFTTGWDDKINKDGFCTYATWPTASIPHAYVQFSRNGIIESIDMGMLLPRGELKYIPIVKFEKDIIEHIRTYYLKALKTIDIKLPVAISISLLDIEGYFISLYPNYPRDIIKEHTLRLPVMQINSWDEDISKVLKPSFDRLWNHCGFESSLNYDENGNWSEFRPH